MSVHNRFQNTFHSSPTLEFLLNTLRSFIKISEPLPKPPKRKMRASPTLSFLSMPQYRHSFKVVFIFFVPHKIGLKKLFRIFFQNSNISSRRWNMTLSLVALCGVIPVPELQTLMPIFKPHKSQEENTGPILMKSCTNSNWL